MEGLRKRILLDVFVTPWTVLPVVAGVSLLLLAEIAPVLGFFGFMGVMLGLGALATNVVFNLDKISKRAVDELMAKQQKIENAELDRLARKLRQDPDTRDEQYLADLRTLYTDFRKDIQDGKISRSITTDLVDQIEEVFKACVHSLEQQFDMLMTAQKMSGDVRNEILRQREELLQEVGRNVSELAKLITQVRTMKMRASKREMEELRGSLRRSLEVAKQVEAFTLGTNRTEADDVIDRYAEYQQHPAKE
jgi:NADH:ubiquinone oxidoreductase subunit E